MRMQTKVVHRSTPMCSEPVFKVSECFSRSTYCDSEWVSCGCFSTLLFSRVPSQKAGCRRARGHKTLVSSPRARVWQKEMELQSVGHGGKDGLLFLRGEPKLQGWARPL